MTTTSGAPSATEYLPCDFLAFLEDRSPPSSAVAWLAETLLDYRPGPRARAMASGDGSSTTMQSFRELLTAEGDPHD